MKRNIVENTSADRKLRCRFECDPHRDGDLPQDVLRDGQALLNHLLVELVQGRVHQLHADPHVALATQVWEEVRPENMAPKEKPGQDVSQTRKEVTVFSRFSHTGCCRKLRKPANISSSEI